MRALATTVLCALPLAGCSGWVVFISPTSVGCTPGPELIPSPTRPPPLRPIGSGATVHGSLSSCHAADEFDVAADADGVLVVRVRWDDAQTSTISLLSVNGVEFRSRPPDWPPIVARVPMTKRHQYRLRVALGDSTELREGRYSLTTAVESTTSAEEE